IKLLEFLETGEFENAVTGEKKKADVRLIVASRKDLAKEAKEGRFREDLFYKLNVAPVNLPALRERKEDLPKIVDFFL
ncbi:sigma 54-interacting transcriptional regulator, partial [Acinetobacter baumannii]